MVESLITSEYLIKLVKACTVISGPGKMMTSTESIKVSQCVRAAITSYRQVPMDHG